MSSAVPDGWTLEPIGNLIGVLTDYTANGSFAALKEEVTYFNNPEYAALVRTTDLEKKSFEPARFTDKKGFDFLRKSELFAGDIVIANVGSAGKSYRVPQYHMPLTLAPNMYLVKFNDRANDDFAFQVITSETFLQKLLDSCANTTLKAINKTSFRAIGVFIPPLPEQKKIASILTSVDEVIEKTESQIAKLQELKTGMMQELLTKGVGHTEFKDSPVGRIPVGWDVLPLGEIATNQRGKFSHRPRNDPRFYGGDIPFIQTGDIPKDSPFIEKHSQSLNSSGLSVSKLFPKRTLVITIAATIGEIGVLQFDSCFPDSLVGITANTNKTTPFFLLYMMRYRKEELISLAPQTAQKNINLDTLNPFPIPVPPLQEQELISNSILSVDNSILQINVKLTTLRESKKALMQDLLTGKVRVKTD